MYHSQIGQDKWIHELYSGKKSGYFVDVGAYDGVTISNTFHLEKELGWNGICVEPLPEVFKKLVSNRSCYCVNSCVATSGGTVWFKCRGKGSRIVSGEGKKTVVRTSETLEEILSRNDAPAMMEYLNLDIEGTELEVLQSFPFHKYSFGAITVEHNSYLGQAYQDRREIMKTVLSSNGYALEMEVQQDDWYVNRTTFAALTKAIK